MTLLHPSPTRRLAASAIGALMLCAATLGSAAAQSETYPNKPIRLIVGFAAGGSTDVVARLVADALSTELGQPVVVENRAGASSAIASELVALAPPDGYTLQMGTLTSHVLNIGLQKNRKQRFDLQKDFAPIALLAVTPTVLGVSKAVGARDLGEFMELLRENPDKYNYASSSPGGMGHLAALLFNNAIGATAVHVPYKGASESMSDLADGRVHYFFSTLSVLGPLADHGRIQLLALSSHKRNELWPAVPTLVEAGGPDISVSTFTALFAPAKTPAAIQARLNAAANKILQDPALIASLTKTGNEAPKPMSISEVNDFLERERKQWLPVLETVKIDH